MTAFSKAGNASTDRSRAVTDWKTPGRARVVAVEHVGVGPDLRIEGAAAGVEDADDRPRPRPDAHRRAKVEPLIRLGGVAADDDLVEPLAEEAPLDDLDVVAHLQHALRHAAHLDVGVAVGAAHRQRRDHHHLRADQRLGALPHHLRQVLDDAHVVELDGAGHLGVGAGLLHDGVLRQPGRDDAWP